MGPAGTSRGSAVVRRLICTGVLACSLAAINAGSADAASCPGANPCPYTGAPTVLGRFGVSYFNAQAGVAVDASGNQYLTDWNNNRVIKLDSSGHQLWAVGANNAGGQSGTGNDQFNHPYELRLSPDGTKLYVADGFNDRIEELNTSDGSVVTSWGTRGTGASQFNLDAGLGIDPINGDVYVADYHQNRIEEFDPNGNFMAMFGYGVSDGVTNAFQVCTSSCHVGFAGGGNGQFSGPIGIAVDSSHNVYVADNGNNRVQKLGPAPTFTYATQSASGLLNQPYGVAFDGSGNVLVADAGHNELQKLSPTLAFVESYGWGVADGMAQSETCTSSCQNGISGTGDGQFSFPEDVTVDSLGNIHVADNGNNREQQLSSSGTYLSKIVSPSFPNTDLRLNAVSRILPTAAGNMWLSDLDNNRVVEISPTGMVLAKIGANNGDGAPGGGSGLTGADGISVSFPQDLAFDPSGNLWLADAGNNRIDEFNSTGGFIKTIGWGVSDGLAQFETCTANCRSGIAGTGNGQFAGPQGLAIDTSGNLYIGDTLNCRVEELSSAGTFITRWGAGGGDGECNSGPSQFSSPVTVRLDAAGNVWVADYNNSNVQEFTPSGGYIKTVGGPGTIGGTFDGPQQLAFDSADDLLVADSLNDRAQLLDPADGSFAFAWGGPSGSTPGPGDFGEVGGVAVLPNDQVALSDQGNGRVELFTFPVPASSLPTSTPAATHAALGGTIDPGGGVAAYHFEWGPTSAYGNVTPAGGTGPGVSAQPVGATITGLTSNTTYHWRLVASTPAGSSATPDQTLTTMAFGAGPAGSQGLTGRQGLTGNVGSAGAPGRDAIVTCAKPKLKKKKVTVKCTLALRLPASRHVWIRLARRGRVYATGHAITKRAGIYAVPLTAHGVLRGRYRLTVLLAASNSRARSFSWMVKL
jgi:tripartite motif-containing protein 71